MVSGFSCGIDVFIFLFFSHYKFEMMFQCRTWKWGHSCIGLLVLEALVARQFWGAHLHSWTERMSMMLI